MIEFVSSPADLAQWRPPTEPFYLEIFGETSPILDTTSAEVVPAGKADAVSTSPAPVYEYWWTLGHPGAAPQAREPGETMSSPRHDNVPIWENLRDMAARVYLYFPVNKGWRVREIIATVKYLTPVHQQQSWWTQAGNDLKLLLPLIGDAGNVAGLVPGGATASKWLTTISKLQVSSVPQSKEFPWSVEKVTFGGNGHEVMQGVLWNLPRSLLAAQGGRLTGSLAVSVIPACQQAADGTAQSAIAPGTVKAHAGVYAEDGREVWIPGPDARSFAELRISPQLPPAAVQPGQDGGAHGSPRP
jgi:hypothetical protein